MAEWFGTLAPASHSVMHEAGWVRVTTLLGDAALPATGISVICDMATNFYMYFYDNDQKMSVQCLQWTETHDLSCRSKIALVIKLSKKRTLQRVI